MEGCTPGLGPQPGGGTQAWPQPQTRSWPWSLCPVAPSRAQQHPVEPSRAQQHPAPQLMLGDLLPPGPEGAAPLWFLGAGQNI